MIEVELPDGGVAEFDDATPHDIIKNALSKYKAPAAAKPAPKAPIGQSTVAEMGTLGRMAAGAGAHVDSMLDGLTQMTLKASGHQGAVQAHNNTIQQKEREFNKPLEDTTSGAVGGALGDLGMQAVAGAPLKAAGIARPLQKAMDSFGGKGARNIATQMATSAATQGAFNSLKAVNENEGDTRAGNAGIGAALGAGGNAVGQLIGRGINGLVPLSREIAKLPQKAREALTLGQAADKNTLPGKIVAGAEEKMSSLPLLGRVVAQQRQGGVDAFRDAVVDSTAPKGMNVVRNAGDTTWDTVDQIGREYTNRYSAALRGKTVTPSQLFESQALKMSQDPTRGLSQQEADAALQKAMRYYEHMMHAQPQLAPAGTAVMTGQRGVPLGASGDQAKGFEAFLTKQARQAAKGGSDDMASLYGDLERAWSTAYRRQLGPAGRAPLKELDQGYAPFKTVERAATYVGNDQGAFTPAQLLSAVKARTPLSRYARGDGLLQSEAGAGKQLLQNHVPNSGTADRALGAGALAGLLLDPSGMAQAGGTIAAGALPLFLTKTGRNAMTGSTYTQQVLQRLRADKLAEGQLGAFANVMGGQ